MKVISVVVPTYNEAGNVCAVYTRVKKVFAEHLRNYGFELLFEDNCSQDRTRMEIEQLCREDHRVKAVFNAKNFGFTRSTYYALLQATGDAAVLMYADMQDPPEMIPEFVRKWEEGYLVITGIKASSRENPLMTGIRKLYYGILKRICEVEHIGNYNGFGLYDRCFLDVLRDMKDPYPYFRGIVAELAPKRCEVEYTHQQRQQGKTHMDFLKLYDVAMAGITSYSKAAMRLATLLGGVMGCGSVVIALVTLARKLLYWDSFPIGNAAILIGVFAIGAMQLFFTGLIGEYIVSISIRTMGHPLVVEEKRLNFQEDPVSESIRMQQRKESESAANKNKNKNTL